MNEKIQSIIKSHTFNAPIKSVYQGLSCYEMYPKFIKGVKTTEIVKTVDPKASLAVKYKLNLIKTFSYTLDMYHIKNKSITWQMRDSDFFTQNSGSWQLEKYGDNYTNITYELKVDFVSKIPSFITKKLTEKSLPMMFKDFQRLIDSIESNK